MSAADLERVRAQLARFVVAGPIPIAFTASDAGDGIAIVARAIVPDACAWRDEGRLVNTTVSHSSGVLYDAPAAEIERVIVMLTRQAYDHERREWVLRDGVAIGDPHRKMGPP